MKILQFVTRLDLGGAQECCLDQCRLLLEKGHEVHLLTGTGGELMPEARAIEGLVVHAWSDWAHAIRPAADLRCLTRLAATLGRLGSEGERFVRGPFADAVSPERTWSSHPSVSIDGFPPAATSARAASRSVSPKRDRTNRA